ncbi:glycosyltransferase family 2 protein [Sphingobacterium sp. SYP-B4668]|uniref:glycosyltransferase family 2 protein n=1 Tax=Sphingobacterium sp. SYP-B4668 TaxID=2996035 RepID=UPI0022DD5611|nr:glycosyltransferase family 2 protein [Sphingobacterium sp. SYP-B4668]
MKNFQFKISVIVPVFNVVGYLERALESLFNQTLQDMEFVLVDDCSTDGSYELLLDILERNHTLQNRIQISRHEQNKGVAATRNTGLSLAKGKYLGAIDPDDWADLDMFENMLKTAEENNADIVWCDYFNEYPQQQVYVKQDFKEEHLDGIQGLIQGKILGGMCTKLVAHDLFTKHHIQFPEGLNMCEDLRVNVQLFYYADRVAYLKQAPYHYTKYREDSLSVSSEFQPVVNKSWILNIAAIEGFIMDKHMNHLKKDIQLLKLIPKQNLLVRATKIVHYKAWNSIFPESNRYIWKGSLPWYYKLIAVCVMNEIWFIPKLWMQLKRMK